MKNSADGLVSISVKPVESGVVISFTDGSGAVLSVLEARAISNSLDRNLFRFEGSSSFSGLGMPPSADDAFPFDPSDLVCPQYIAAETSIFLSFPLIYAISFGHLLEATNLKESDLRELGIPGYVVLRPRVAAVEDYRHPQFRMRLELYDKYSVRITPRNSIGQWYFINDRLELLTPTAHALITRYLKHEEIRMGDEYRSSPEARKREFSILRSIAIKAGAQLDTFIAKENVIFLEFLPYEILRDALNRPLIAPVLPWANRDLDFSFQQLLERRPDDSLPDHIPVKRGGDGSRVRVAFSSKAWDEYKLVKKLASDETGLIEEVIANPQNFFSSDPRVAIDDVFSERVAGFLLGKQTTNRADAGESQSWAAGFGENSLILRTGPSSMLRLDSAPTPVEYEILKKAYKDLHAAVALSESQSSIDSGFEFTPLPPQFEQKIKIPEFNAEVSLTELHSVCKAIEVNNMPKLTDEQIPKAEEVLLAAVANGMVVLDWVDESGVKGTIPVESLRKAIPKVRVDNPEDLHVSPLLCEAVAKVGLPPNWHWRDSFPSRVEGLKYFKPGIQLQAHQEIGYAWLRWLSEHKSTAEKGGHRGALLADDMGLGKTIQTLALITHYLSNEETNLPVLIVAPQNLITDSWKKDAVEAFLEPGTITVADFKDCPVKVNSRKIAEDAIRVTEEMASTGRPFHQCAISADLKNDIRRIQEWSNGKLVFSTYETMSSRSVILASLKFGLVILDEAQKIKNVGVLQSNAAKALKSDFYVAMTGTPIENSLMDLWSIMDFAVPGKLGGQVNFRTKFLNRIKAAEPGTVARSKLRNELEEALNPVWMRRTKAEIFKDDPKFPSITHYDSVVSSDGSIGNIHLVKMSPSQKDMYDGYMGIYNTLAAGHRLAAIARLLEVCSSPWLADNIPVNWENHEKLFSLCPKLRTTFEILERIAAGTEANGKKVVLFARTIQTQISLAYLIADWHRKTKAEKIEVEVFNGESKAFERSEMLARFKSKPGFQVLIISPKSGGAGLNIVEANHVIHYTREWNPVLESQATARCYRMGQSRKVHVYYPTTSTGDSEAPSAEEHLADILRSKRDVMEDFTISLVDQVLAEDTFGSIRSKSPRESTVQLNGEKVASLSPVQFEKLVSTIFSKKGFRTYWVGAAGDRGADVVAISDTDCFLIQTKHTQVGSTQNSEGINEVRGAHTVYEKLYAKRFKLVVATNGQFSEKAMIHSRSGTEVALWDISWLQKELASSFVFLHEVESVGRS